MIESNSYQRQTHYPSAATMNVLPENEANIDANLLLTELDKGLRSTRVGDQCEAIVRFPWLFERYPFPILINSASLKLSEVYRNGSNFLRVLILQVMRESEKHLDKIVNIDEFVRRLFAVTFSNDPLARTITLRTLANMARIVSHRKSIHHYIRNSLDSNDEMEVLAAIEAAASFAAQSQEFAANIHPKVFTMINGLTTPLEIKTKLLLVLNNVHYNCEVADKVRHHCVEFLSTYASEKFICSNLRTLTHIASVSLTQIPDQIDILLQYFIDDPRNNVKLSVLSDLTTLAAISPHLWQKKSSTALVDAIIDVKNRFNGNSKLLAKAMSVLAQLSSSPTLFSDEPQYYQELSDKIIAFCLQIVYNEENFELISISICILTNISLNLNSKYVTNADIMQETCCAIQSFLLSSVSSGEQNYSEIETNSLKTIFKCILSVCRSLNSSSITMIFETLRFLIMNVKMESIWFGLTSQVICAIVSNNAINDTFFDEDILQLIRTSSQLSPISDNFSNLLTIYFQIHSHKATQISEPEAQTLLSCFTGKNLWICFKVVRQAMRYGQHMMAASILERMKTCMEPIESIYFWVNCLTNISKAESYLLTSIEQMNKNFYTSISLYIEGLTELKASICGNNPMTFQTEFVRLRLKYLQTQCTFRQCCQMLKMSPPPAIAASTALTTRDDMLKCGTIVVSMRKSAKEFRSLADAYSLLYQSSFNADTNTLAQIQLLQNSCVILAEAIENLFQSNRLNALFVSKDSPFEGNANLSMDSSPLEHRSLIKMCSKISQIIHRDLNSLQTNESIGSKQISLLLDVSSRVLRTPLCFPRFFFQAIQNTCIKLAISPQPKSGDVLLINNNTHFALRIEGVVVNINQKCVRKVGKVLICVNGVLVSRSTTSNDQTLKTDPNLSLQSVVVPLNDYFQVQFLLSLPITGLYSINIETSIIDENEAQWKTGPKLSLSAKVIDNQSAN